MSRGFTAVEVLVTIFIAALFILGGYQLYGAVNLRAADAREFSQASTVGYSVLRSQGSVYKDLANSCASESSVHKETVGDPTSIAGASSLPNVEIVIRRCRPSLATSSILRVAVTVYYGANYTNKKEVTHVIYLHRTS